jgi:hypothetical protein
MKMRGDGSLFWNLVEFGMVAKEVCSSWQLVKDFETCLKSQQLL